MYNKVLNQIEEREFNAYTLFYAVKDKEIRSTFTEAGVSFIGTDISM